MSPVRDKASELYFIHADARRFEWMTRNKTIAAMEKSVLSRIPIGKAQRVLEVGCGEGANIYNLQAEVPLFVGLDLYPEKLRFASSRIKKAKFVCGDALAMPFPDNYFDFVFCRDVLHHVGDKAAMFKEMIRVLKPGSPFIILEANGKNPVWYLFGTLVKAERHLRRNTADEFRRLLEREGPRSTLKAEIGFLYMPVFFRLLAHYKFGLQALGNSGVILSLSRSASGHLKRYFNKEAWAYIIISGVKNNG